MRLKQLLVGATSVIAISSVSSVAFAGAVTSKEDISIKTTGGGIKVKSDNGNSFSIGGRIMYDYDNYDGAFNAANDGDTGSESEFRRLRTNIKGTSGKNWAYKLTLDFEDDDEDDANIDTAYLRYKGFEKVDLTLGRDKLPVGLEELTSSKNITTIERSVVTSDFNILAGKPDFLFSAHANFNNLFLQGSLIDEGNEDDDDADAYSVALRAGGKISLGEDNKFIHLAGSYAKRDFGDEGAVGFETEGGVHAISDDLQVNGDQEYEVDDADQYGLEAALVNGPFSLQGEYFSADFDGDTNGAGDISEADVDVDAFYILGSYFLTGESRPYKGSGKFDKIKPKGPRGAWELVAKYEDGEVDPDASAGDIAGFEGDAEYEVITLGVNWYPNQNLKFMLNYLDIDTDGFNAEDGADTLLDTIGEEDGNAFSLRAQYAF